MKRFALCMIASAFSLMAHAQLFSPESWNGTVLGGIVGGIIGNNSHGRTGEGIAIGAAAGWLLGTIAHGNRVEQGWYSSGYVYARPPVVAYTSPYPPVSYSYGYAPGYVYSPPDYARSAAVFGGITGGIIGHNNHGRTAEGVAIGTGAGLLLGSIADAATYRRDGRTTSARVTTTQPIRAAQSTPARARMQPAPARPPAPVQPASFRQIPDAPRAPDAPTF
jgi:uncharacterized protein YcfJ